jgi:hypothetical protein
MDVVSSLVRVYSESILKNWNCPITFGKFPISNFNKICKDVYGIYKKNPFIGILM